MDRQGAFDIVPGEVQIFWRRSSARPIVYAFMLRFKSPDGWNTTVSIDNNHPREGAATHHLHRYSDGRKEPPEGLPFEISNSENVNEAMREAMRWMRANWKDFAR